MSGYQPKKGDSEGAEVARVIGSIRSVNRRRLAFVYAFLFGIERGVSPKTR